MSIKKMDMPAFEKWVDACIQHNNKVYGVRTQGDHFSFAELERAGDLRLDYDVTILPPKKYFQPTREILLKFSRENTEYETVLDTEPFVLFGVHPYDMAAISQMDMVFARDHRDEHYLTRRAGATVVVSDVQTPSRDVFAGCLGTAVVDKGFDVLVTKIEDGYVVDARTEKGETLVSLADGATEAGEADLTAREAVWEENRKQLRKHELKMDPSEIPALLERSHDHPVWEEKAELCYSCGSCNLVCPTCYCFDVQEDVHWDLNCGERCRSWDGCLLADFAMVAGKHNFRGKRADRYRHRYYRKGKYVPDMIGEISCVGCGRCITACTAKIANPVEVYNRLLEEK